MEEKYNQAIKAGVIGGIILAFFTIVNFIIGVIATSSPALSMLGLLNCCIFILLIIIMAGVGALGVRMASLDIQTLSEAVSVSAVAGAVAGLISGAVYAITQVISPLVSSSDSSQALQELYGISQVGQSAIGGLCGICFCGPVVFVIAIVLAIIGGAIYALVVLKVP